MSNMARDPFASKETDLHVRKHKNFFPSSIPVLHPQLRHLITCPQSNLVYFVNQKNVYCLDTSTHKRTHIAQLPFEPRCTATGHGWFCAGGEKQGYFAALRIPGASSHHGSSESTSFDTADGPTRPRSLLEQLGSFGRPNMPGVRVERLGEEIVNSISIHRVSGEEGELDDVVAVVTNNDATVRLYSLSQDDELKREDFPFPMNHATISPNGQMMVVVGDQETIYFYKRTGARSSMAKRDLSSDQRYASTHFEKWREFTLHKPALADHSAYFTTAWSSSSKLCATASEQGYITVFDTDLIADAENDADAVVALIPSSRPSNNEAGPGGVRAMCFAPDPWDFLFWAEHQGRLCVGDLRTGLATRQVIDLDPRGEDVKRIELHDASSVIEDPEDLEMEIEFIRRHQRAIRDGDNTAAMNFITDYLAATSERRRSQRRSGPEPYESDPQGLTEDEREILETLRVTRERQEALQRPHDAQLPTWNRLIANEQRLASPRSINYLSNSNSNVASNRGGSQTPSETSSPAGASAPRNYLHDEIARRNRESALVNSLRDIIRRRGGDSSSIDDSVLLRGVSEQNNPSLPSQPRRRNSVHRPSSTSSFSERPNRPLESSNTGGGSSDPIDAEAWQTIQDELTRASPLTSTRDSATSNNLASTNPPNVSRTDQPGDRTTTALPSPRDSRLANTTSQNTREDFTTNANLERRIRLYAAAAESNTARLRRAERELLRGPGGTVSTPPPDSTRGLLPELAARAAGAGTGMGTMMVGLVAGRDDDIRDGDRTTGVAWGDGGRTLYVGIQEGIFELKLNYDERKFWPAFEPR